MDSNYKAYNHVSSFSRIDDILALPSGNYEETHELPDRDKLTYTNGFYASCSALFADIRKSSSLPEKYKRPRLAKLYRAYISEMVAIMNGSEQAREINIVGDGVWAVFNTPYKRNIDEVFSVIARCNSLVKVLNFKLSKAGYSDPIEVGFGAAYGRALMIKAGYSGSGISDIVYMGDVVNKAAKLAAKGSSGFLVPPIMLDHDFNYNLNEDNQKLTERDWARDCYTANVVNVAMEDWYKENCK
ncbi:adenylate/guanylate cyclase domain-containing protein [Streptomyces sp. NPDC001663]|uniref:adenylate/guanylate cyclase domain-containing protein n=1 Tax=Streptomyces sp. NPDC001663 TaxID=3364597 RepID=UPI00367C9FE9